MENSSQNGNPEKSATSADQTQQPTTSEPRTQPTPTGNGVFLMRAKGQSFEEFVEFCVKRFGEAGLLSDYKPKK
jgi:hypothetical protein